MNLSNRPFGPGTAIGWVLALLGLILTVVFWATHTIGDPQDIAILFVLAFLALLF